MSYQILKDWLSGVLYKETGESARQTAMLDALGAITTAAINNGECKDVHRLHTLLSTQVTDKGVRMSDKL